MQQINRRTPMPKQQSSFIETILRRGCSPVNLLHIFWTPFPKNTYPELLLSFTPLNIDRSIFRTLSNIYNGTFSESSLL